MCLLLVSYGMSKDAVAVIGANREEAYERGGEPPGLHRGQRSFVGGIDPRAGGTWLGINDCGVLVAITNRPDRPIPKQARSRGLLARDLLGMRSSAEAAALATTKLTTGHYVGCNVVIIDASSGHVISAAESVRGDAMRPGIHGLTNGNVDDKIDSRISYALQELGKSDLTSAAQTARALQEICSGASPDAPQMCLHCQEGGTVSSSVIVLRAPVFDSEIWHCQGSPDRRPYENCSQLFCELGRPLMRAIR